MRPEKLRLWQRQMETNAGGKVLTREVAILRKANEIIKAAAMFFAK